MYSLTQGGNLTVIVGLIGMILAHWNINIAPNEVEQLVVAIGVVISWFGRYRQGDIKLSGFRK